MTNVFSIYFDGGCRPNPGQGEIGIAMKTGDDLAAKPSDFTYYQEGIGLATNNMAEWLALIVSVDRAKSAGAGKSTLLRIRGDSQLIINQATGLWKCRAAELQPYHEAFREIMRGVGDIDIAYVPRARNLAGNFLERRWKTKTAA